MTGLNESRALFVLKGSDIETLAAENGADYDPEEVGGAPAQDQPAPPQGSAP